MTYDTEKSSVLVTGANNSSFFELDNGSRLIYCFQRKIFEITLSKFKECLHGLEDEVQMMQQFCRDSSSTHNIVNIDDFLFPLDDDDDDRDITGERSLDRHRSSLHLRTFYSGTSMIIMTNHTMVYQHRDEN
jgi:hypothetical protein